jgi:hypothetical protein
MLKKNGKSQPDLVEALDHAIKALNVIMAAELNSRCVPFVFGTWAKKKSPKKMAKRPDKSARTR